METFTFFRALFEDAERGWLTLWTRPDEKSYWFECTELDKASWEALQLSKQGKDVYFGVGLRREKVYNVSKTGKKYLARGKAGDVIAIPGIWMDIDIYDPEAHKEKALPKTLDEAIQFLMELQTPPTIMVNSGHGLHAYWLFPRTLYLEDEDRHEWASVFLKNFQYTIKYLAKEKGWNLDTTSDLARVLRVPGTKNYKDKDNPKTAEVIHFLPNTVGLTQEDCDAIEQALELETV